MHNKKVLIIDDDVDLCQIIKFTFGHAGAKVFTALDRREGLTRFCHKRPDLVILNIRMPDMNGWETCRQIRRLSNVPVIILVTPNPDEENKKVLDCGADDFIAKPFSQEVLMARSRAVLRRAEQADEVDFHFSYNDIFHPTQLLFQKG